MRTSIIASGGLPEKPREVSPASRASRLALIVLSSAAVVTLVVAFFVLSFIAAGVGIVLLAIAITRLPFLRNLALPKDEARKAIRRELFERYKAERKQAGFWRGLLIWVKIEREAQEEMKRRFPPHALYGKHLSQ